MQHARLHRHSAPRLDADVGWCEPSPGADAAGASPAQRTSTISGCKQTSSCTPSERRSDERLGPLVRYNIIIYVIICCYGPCGRYNMRPSSSPIRATRTVRTVHAVRRGAVRRHVQALTRLAPHRLFLASWGQRVGCRRHQTRTVGTKHATCNVRHDTGRSGPCARAPPPGSLLASYVPRHTGRGGSIGSGGCA